MTHTEAARILRDHNDWRRSKGRYEDPTGDEWAPPLPPLHTPAQIGEAIDVLCDLAENQTPPPASQPPPPGKRA